MCPYMNMTSPEPCMSGHYCVEGEPSPIPCPAGTFNNVTMLSTEDECTDCSPGTYCSGAGNSYPTGLCTAGYYCEGAAKSPIPVATVDYPNNGICPPGSYCDEGTPAPKKCPPGTIRPSDGATGIDDCSPCPGGHYCSGYGQTSETGLCYARFYCPANDTTSHPEPGHLKCPVGHYCLNGTTEPYPCPTGTYQPNEGFDECEPCQAGFIVKVLWSQIPSLVQHHYCPAATMYPIPCPNGTFTYDNTTKLKSAYECQPCKAGVYCRGGYIVGPCPLVISVWQNGTAPIKCPLYTFRDTPGATSEGDCTPCRPGFWCNDTGIVNYRQNPCPVGHYCERAMVYPEPCTGGRMSTTTGRVSNEDCPLCTPGYYCPNDTINVHGIPCRPTYECPEGASIEVVCRPGHYCEGVTGDPPICPGGYYCPLGSSFYTRCFFPKYCPEGSEVPVECPLGYMAVNHANIRPDIDGSCQICPAGTYGNHTERWLLLPRRNRRS
uniref:Multiple epidermal growth factor-like domains protein 11-like n=1 Tax=Saccoglossus kowalevskii TaxID=10224 RepID=A0ABM0MX48_SACKO|nr:PREDICTED: multiple epidermal growth factor-like domains protein 11-like [Saccoglossus kowalevskii]